MFAGVGSHRGRNCASRLPRRSPEVFLDDAGRVADGTSLVGDLGVEQSLGDDRPRDTHHLLVDVEGRAVVPVGCSARGVGGHGLTVGGDPLTVKRGLHEPSLAKPQVTFGGKQSIPQECSHQADTTALDEVAVPHNEHFFDGVWVVDQQAGERAEAHWHDVAVVARAPGIESELVAIELTETPEEGVALRPAVKSGGCR